MATSKRNTKPATDPVEQWLSNARLDAVIRAKYMASGINALIPIPAPGLGTFAVTPRWHMLYDPELHKVWSFSEAATVMLHELGHLLREHSRRCIDGGLDPELWNRAGDAEINDDLPGNKFPTKTSAGKVSKPIMPADFKMPNGQTAEVYYAAALKQAQSSSSGSGSDSDAAQPRCRCGSGAGGTALPEEKLADAVEGRSEAEGKRLQKRVAEAIQQQASQKPGSVPGDWLVWAGGALAPPRIPWQAKLAKLCRNAVTYKAGFGAQTYAKMNRRQHAVGDGFRLAAPLSPVPRVMVGFDTSGSMGSVIEKGMAEVQGIMRAVGASVDFVALDTEIQGRARVSNVKECKKLLGGGGGTDFRPLFEAADGRNKPDVLVFVTDGYGPAPEVPPRGVNVIWLLVPGGQCPVTWGTEVRMEE